MSNSYYSILELPETATQDEIKKAYRRLSMLHHPDKNKNNLESTEKFKKIAEAYETLSDSDKKREYDMTQNNPFAKMMGSSNGMEDLFSSLFGMPFGPMGPGGMGVNGFGMGQNGMGKNGMPQNMNPFGNTPFGPHIRVFHNGVPVNVGGFGNINALQKPTPIIQTVSVPIDKILTGTTIPIEIERWIIVDETKVFEKETMYLNVPKGIDEGEIILLREKGNTIREDCRGDIKIFIKIENDTEFRRNGLDLLLDKTITIKEALCGFSFDLKYITGKVYTITNNSGTIISHGYRKVIPNMGFSRDQHTGNLIILFNVMFPEKINEEAMEQLKKIDF
jgi:DnaJ family protein B protein 4